ncbi:hypothetical protein EHQ58_18560, partial [Leptospira ognonensis]
METENQNKDYYLDFENSVFIVDSISSALIISILSRGKAINCIFEIKQIDWRKANFVLLYE